MSGAEESAALPSAVIETQTWRRSRSRPLRATKPRCSSRSTRLVTVAWLNWTADAIAHADVFTVRKTFLRTTRLHGGNKAAGAICRSVIYQARGGDENGR